MLRGELGERLNAAQKVGRVWSLWLASPVCACSMASRGDVKVSVEAFFGAEYPELSFETEVGSLSLLRQPPGLLRRAAAVPGRAIDYGDAAPSSSTRATPRPGTPGSTRVVDGRRRHARGRRRSSALKKAGKEEEHAAKRADDKRAKRKTSGGTGGTGQGIKRPAILKEALTEIRALAPVTSFKILPLIIVLVTYAMTRETEISSLIDSDSELKE
ncbi:hypothetical protein JL720_5381 [Aureococcus anophagefferens]|nr:hypothetical protein JL720_5381 [Aureococcus anophagefferens]